MCAKSIIRTKVFDGIAAADVMVGVWLPSYSNSSELE